MMLEEEILFVLECPVCLKYMSAPIFQCPIGHSVCGKCFIKLTKCPTCTVDFYEKQRRNFALEDISRIVPCPCPNEAYGCSESIKIHNIEAHYDRCRFRPYKCIFADDIITDDGLCDFKGSKLTLMEHMRNMHEEYAWMRSVSEDRLDEDAFQYDIQVALCYDEMFYFHRRYKDGLMYWCLQYIGDREDAKNYTYELQISHDDGRMISFTCIAQADNLSFDDIIESGHYVGIPVRLLKLFSVDKQLTYLVTINRKT